MKCWSDKLQYQSKKGAQGAAKRMRRIHRLHPEAFVAYHCRTCRFWHVGNMHERLPNARRPDDEAPLPDDPRDLKQRALSAQFAARQPYQAPTTRLGRLADFARLGTSGSADSSK